MEDTEVSSSSSGRSTIVGVSGTISVTGSGTRSSAEMPGGEEEDLSGVPMFQIQ